MSFKFKIYLLIIFILIQSYISFAIAGKCSADITEQNIVFDELSVHYDNTHFPYKVRKIGSEIKINCQQKGDNYVYVKSIEGIKSVSGYYFNTNLNGVKLRWALERKGTGAKKMGLNGYRRIREGNKKIFIGHFNIIIYPDFQAGEVNPIKITLAHREGNQDTGETLFTYHIPKFKIKEQSCKVKTPKLNVQMGTVFKNNFKGKGSTTGERNFNIEVNCKGVNQAYITWQGGDSNGVIPADKNSSATGVGIQIFAKNTPIIFNKKLDIDFFKQLTYSAKFYQTGSSVTAGTVNATATFTIDYK